LKALEKIIGTVGVTCEVNHVVCVDPEKGWHRNKCAALMRTAETGCVAVKKIAETGCMIAMKTAGQA
jgi:hypothetical protein